jgi:hypothetical protein
MLTIVARPSILGNGLGLGLDVLIPYICAKIIDTTLYPGHIETGLILVALMAAVGLVLEARHD